MVGHQARICGPKRGVERELAAYTFASGGVPVADEQCSPCSPGSFSIPGQPSCDECVAGTYRGDDDLQCLKCPANTYSAAGAEACTTCAAGYSSPPGAGTCDICDAGRYRGTSDETCINCPSNEYSAAGADACTPCDVGYSSPPVAGTCDICEAGRYRGAGDDTCIRCDAGTFSGAGAASSSATSSWSSPERALLRRPRRSSTYMIPSPCPLSWTSRPLLTPYSPRRRRRDARRSHRLRMSRKLGSAPRDAVDA